MSNSFATNCCLLSVLDTSFDFNDANTVSIKKIELSFLFQTFYLLVGELFPQLTQFLPCEHSRAC